MQQWLESLRIQKKLWLFHLVTALTSGLVAALILVLTVWHVSRSNAVYDADIKAAIGPELGARYEQMRSPEYFTTQAVVSRLGLPATNVPQVIAVQQDIEQRAAQLRTVPATTFADRQRQLAALAAEANQRLSPLLGGDRGIETYKKNGGYWLQNLTPVVVPTPSPSTPTTPPR